MSRDIATYANPAAYVLLTADGVDQIVNTMTQAKREKRDLERMGCNGVKIKAFATWADAEAYEDKMKGY